MNSKFEVIEIDAEEASLVVGGVAIPRFLRASSGESATQFVVWEELP